MNKSCVKPLSALSLGENGIVKYFTPDRPINRRLFDIGLIKGTKISCVLQNPSGNPMAFLIRGAIMALRAEDCGHILVEVRHEA